MKKVLLALSLMTALMLSACTKTGTTDPGSKTPDPSQQEKRKVYIEMQTQYFNESNGTKIELGQFSGEIDDTTKAVNKDLVDQYDHLYQSFKNAEGSWVELNYYPMTNKNYVNLSILELRLPTMTDFGRIESYAWDNNAEKLLKIEDAFEIEGITEKRLLEKIDLYARKELDMGCTQITSVGFVMNEDGSVTFIVSVEAYMLDVGFGRNWWFTVDGDKVAVLEQFPFEDAQLDNFEDFTLNAKWTTGYTTPETDTQFPQPDMDNDYLRNNVEIAQMYSRTTRSLPELKEDNDVKYEFTSYPTERKGESGYYLQTYYQKNGKDYVLDDFFVCDTTYGCYVFITEQNDYLPCFTGFGEGEAEECPYSEHYINGVHSDDIHQKWVDHGADPHSDYSFLRVPYTG